MLATLEELKDALGITDTANDAQLTSALSQSNGLIASYVGADLSDATTDRTTTLIAPNGADYVALPVFPVISVSSVTNNGEAVDVANYELDQTHGWIEFLNGLGCGKRYGNRVTVVFKAGFATVPEDLKTVCINIAAAIYNNGGSFADVMNGGRGSLKSMTMFDAMSMSFETGVGASADAAGTPEGMITAWKFVLDQYRCNQPVVK